MDDTNQARLEALAKFQAGFLANASHELRAPMTQIISLHQLILEGLCEDPEEERDFLRQSFEATQRVLANLDLLIGVSKLEIGRTVPRRQELYLQDVCAQLQMLVQMLADNRGCRLQFEVDPDSVVESDMDWLVQALRLLIEGAIAAQSEQIQVRSQPQADPPQLVITTDSAPSRWQANPEKQLDDLPLRSFSPGYCQQVSACILEPLGATLIADSKDHQAFVIVLPVPAAS